jgi:hypothetical protein
MKVKCSYHKLVKVEDLKPNPMNPNQHPEEQIELLAAIIKQIGFRDPVTVSNRSGYIVRGHGRQLAALKLELKKVPVDFQDYQNESDEMADLVADNKIQEFSYFDDEKLKGLLTSIKDDSMWVMTAFDLDEIDKIMTDHTGFLNDFKSEPGSDETDDPDPGAGDSEPGPEKYFRLPLLFSVSDRDIIIAAVSRYQESQGMNMSSDALLKLCEKAG